MLIDDCEICNRFKPENIVESHTDGGHQHFILTTEKDAVRLVKFEQELKDYPVYVLPVEHSFLFDQGGLFEQKILHFISSFSSLNQSASL